MRNAHSTRIRAGVHAWKATARELCQNGLCHVARTSPAPLVSHRAHHGNAFWVHIGHVSYYSIFVRVPSRGREKGPGTRVTCFTGTRVQILTQLLQGSEHTDWINVSIDSCPRLLQLFEHGVKMWNGKTMPEKASKFMQTCLETTGLQLISGDAKKYGIIAWRDWASCRLGSGLALQPGVDMKLFEQLDSVAAEQVL